MAMKPSSSAPPSSRGASGVSSPQKSMMASATQWLSNIREHFELHCKDLPAEARHTAFVDGSWRQFRALEAYVRDRVLDDYLRKHCKCRRWLCLIFASRYPYLAEMGRLVCPAPGARPVSRPLGETSGRSAEDASRGGSVRAPSPGDSQDQAGREPSPNSGAGMEPSLQPRARMARIGTEALRRYILVPEARKGPRSNPLGPLSGPDLRTFEDVLNIEDAWAMSGISSSEEAVASYLAEQFVTQVDVDMDMDMDDASSVCGGTGPRNSPQAESTASPAPRGLRSGPSTHSAPPSTIRTPQPRLRDMPPQAKTTGKRHKIDPASDRVRKRRRTTWASSPPGAGFGSRRDEEAEASEEALASPRRPLWAGTPSGGLLRLRDLRDLRYYGDDGSVSSDGSFDDDPAASRPRTNTPSPSQQIQAENDEYRASTSHASQPVEQHTPSPCPPRRASDAPSRSYDQSASLIIRQVRSPAPSPEPSPPSVSTFPSPPQILPDSMPRPPSSSLHPSQDSMPPVMYPPASASPSTFPSSSSLLSPSPSFLPLTGHEVACKLALAMEAGDLNPSPCEGRARTVPAASVTSQSMGSLWGMQVVLSWMRSRGFCLTRVDMTAEPLNLEIMDPDEIY